MQYNYTSRAGLPVLRDGEQFDITEFSSVLAQSVDALAFKVAEPAFVLGDPLPGAATPTIEKVAGAPDTTPLYRLRMPAFAVVAKNLVDPIAVQTGYTLNTATGAPSALATYSLTGFIPVTAGQQYAVSNPRNVCFYDEAQVYVGQTTGTVNNPTSGPIVVTPPVTGYLRASYVTASYGATFQVEKGSTHTAYEPYGVTIPTLRLPDLPSSGPVELTRTGDLLSMRFDVGGSPLVINATANRTDANGGFNLNTTTLDGVPVHGANPGDEVTPIRTQMGTVGANHGYGTVAVTFTNPDGKTIADVGSVWTDGTREYVLLNITAGKLVMGGSYTVASGVVNVAAISPAGDLTHVSGATHTGTISAASKAAMQLYPSVGRMRVTVWCDGVEILGNATVRGQRVEVRESYEILDYADLYDKAKANIGVPYTDYYVAGAVQMSNLFVFTAGGRCRIRSQLTALKPTNLGTCGFIQAVRLTKSGAQTIRYVPGMLPKSGVDFGAGVDLDTYSQNLAIASADLMAAGFAPTFTLDRLVEGGATTLGFALGYVPFAGVDSDATTRASVTPGNMWDLRGTDKSYPTTIGAKNLTPGQRVTAEGYRSYLTPAQTDAIIAGGRDMLAGWSLLDASAALSGAI